jgi:hypothetical protein
VIEGEGDGCCPLRRGVRKRLKGNGLDQMDGRSTRASRRRPVFPSLTGLETSRMTVNKHGRE